MNLFTFNANQSHRCYLLKKIGDELFQQANLHQFSLQVQEAFLGMTGVQRLDIPEHLDSFLDHIASELNAPAFCVQRNDLQAFDEEGL